MDLKMFETILNVTFFLSIPSTIGIVYCYTIYAWSQKLRNVSYVYCVFVFYMQVVLTKLTPALFFTPRPMGMVTGWLADYPMYISGVVYVSAIPPVALSGSAIVHFKNQMILPVDSIYKLNPFQNVLLWSVLIGVVLVSPMTTTYFMQIYNNTIEEYPNMPPQLQEVYKTRPSSVFAVKASNPFLWMAFSSFAVAIATMSTFMAMHSVVGGKTVNNFTSSSQRTQRMQRDFTRILYSECAMGLITLGGGLGLVMIPVTFQLEWWPHELNFVSAILMAQWSPTVFLYNLIIAIDNYRTKRNRALPPPRSQFTASTTTRIHTTLPPMNEVS